MNTTALTLALVGLLIFLAHLFVVLFRKTRVPDVLLLIAIGFLLGPILGIAHPDHFGRVGPVFAQIALALILFEGGHESRLDVLRENWKSCLGVIFPAFLAAFLLGAGFMKIFADTNNETALLFGAILGSTSPSVVVPMVKQLRMRRGPALVMMMESALADVLCLVLVLGFLEAHEAGGLKLTSMSLHIASSFLMAGAIGGAAGIFWSYLLARIRSIQNNIILSLALVFILYGALDTFHLSGGVAALAFGMAIGNAGTIRLPWLRGTNRPRLGQFTEREKAFFSEAVFVIKTFFFVYLGISLQLKDYWALVTALALVGLVVLIRIPIVRLAMARTTTKRDAALMSVMAPKGLAAAVLASLPLQKGWESGEMIQDLTYGIILFSILGTSVMTFLLESTPFSKLYQKLFRGMAEKDLKPEETTPPKDAPYQEGLGEIFVGGSSKE